MRRVKSELKTFEELRARHRFCISMASIAIAVKQGRIPRYFDQPDKYKAYCDFPEDKLCAAPDVSEESLKRELKRVQEDNQQSE